MSEPLRVKEVLATTETTPTLIRKRLPDDKPADNHSVYIGGSRLHFTVGKDPETLEPKELFIRISKYGATIGGLLDSYATLFSKTLQYGIPLEEALSHMSEANFAPNGVTSYSSLPMAKSIMDYIAKWMLLKYRGQSALPTETDTVNNTAPAELTGDICPECGALMQRTGATCLTCTNCAISTGTCG